MLTIKNMGTTDRSIAQNTILLYIRLIVVIFVAFFTQRLVLKALGVEDYGIYNVVGGLIVVIGIINTGMIQASQRFFAFEIGRGKQSELKNIFGAALTIHALISIFVLLFAEILGVWFLNSIMTIPPDRLLAANFVFQATICSLLITVWTVPFDALIIAKEDFNIYAYISIVEYFLKLGIAYFISTFELYDKLIIYSWLLVLVTILCKLWSIIYGKRKYKECLLKFNKDRNYIKKMLSFASFSFIGNIGFVLRNQGVNLVLNIFFGPAINAARGVAYQVSTQVSSFAGNFQMAATPQITKNYANGNIGRMQSLIYKSSKYSFCLLFILALPVAVNPHPLLELWLIHPPIYSDIFLQLSIVVSLIDCMAIPLGKGIDATGKIRIFQTGICLIMCLDIPLAILLFYLGLPCYDIMFVSIGTSLIGIIFRLILLSKYIPQVSIISYTKNVVIPCILIVAINVILAYYIKNYFSNTFFAYALYCFIVCLFSAFFIFIFCLDKTEKSKIIKIIQNIICRIF